LAGAIAQAGFAFPTLRQRAPIAFKVNRHAQPARNGRRYWGSIRRVRLCQRRHPGV